ncbi:substrate-binding domain-containing protein [Rhodococcus qingshengii]|uniref:substrate-binding domain-containing protein n=1 Tax=Rhodococcus qingshengii TaxID=334542 RepID=UPI001C5F79C6|nr:substrate-binding domain-containing protein [Rhodococcus qingshengii]MBW4818778.1 substrate-binding domain-containing protein [Rhodococcus qingshengii]
MPVDQLRLGLILPMSGPSGIFGPSCQASAEYAISEINSGGGILGREVTPVIIDGGEEATLVMSSLLERNDQLSLDALVGWHTSAVRRDVVKAIGGSIPYVYTAVYEGGEDAAGVFMTGELPRKQIVPAIEWMADLGVRKWFVVGSDYIWPRQTLSVIEESVSQIMYRGVGDIPRIVGRNFVPLGTIDFNAVISSIQISGADGVLVLLLGQDAVLFNRDFAAEGLDRDIARLGPLMDENMLLASGFSATNGLYAVSGFFESLATGYSMDFETGYLEYLGSSAPLITSPGESCYEGIRLLANLAERAGNFDVDSIKYHASDPMDYDSPRGHVRFEDGHLSQDIYIARAEGLDFEVMSRLSNT